MRHETIGEQLLRAHDLIDEALSIFEDLREASFSQPSPGFTRAEKRASAAKRDIRRELIAQDIGGDPRCLRHLASSPI